MFLGSDFGDQVQKKVKKISLWEMHTCPSAEHCGAMRSEGFAGTLPAENYLKILILLYNIRLGNFYEKLV